MFSEEKAQRFPEPRIWDHTIELKKDAPATLPGKIYALTQKERKALQAFIEEHLKKGYIVPSKSPYATLYQKERQKIKTSPRLLTTKRTHHLKPLPPAPHTRAHQLSTERSPILEVQCAVGVQQHMN